MLRTNARIVQACRYGMCVLNLPVIVINDVTAAAVQYTRPPGTERRGMLARIQPTSGRFHAVHGHVRVGNVGMEQAHCI